MVIVRVQVLAQGDAAALAVGHFAVFDDPSLGPVRADHTVLEGCRRRPGGGGLVHLEAAEGDVAHARLGGEEAAAADIDVHLLLVGVLALEVGIDHGLVPFLLRVPFVNGPLRFPGAHILLSLDALLQGRGLIEGAVVQVHGTGVLVGDHEVPVSVHDGGVGVVIPEDGVVYPADPHISLIGLPGLDYLCAGDFRAQGFHTLVGDAGVFRTGVHRVYIFPVHQITGPGHLGRIVDVLERVFLGPVAPCWSIDVHIKGPVLLTASRNCKCHGKEIKYFFHRWYWIGAQKYIFLIVLAKHTVQSTAGNPGAKCYCT